MSLCDDMTDDELTILVTWADFGRRSADVVGPESRRIIGKWLERIETVEAKDSHEADAAQTKT